MTKQEFVCSVVSHYVKGYKLFIFVDKNYKMFKFSFYNAMTMGTIERIYDTFKTEIEQNHYEFF